MEYKVKKNNNATAELIIHFTPQEWDQGYERAYEAHRSKVKIPGFRPGKAPLDMVKKILGDSVIEDAINYTIDNGFKKILPELDPKPYTFPKFKLIEEEKLDRKKGFSVSGLYETFPEVVLPKIKKIKVETYQVEPGEEDIQSELEKIQSSMARQILREEGETSVGGDILEIEYRQTPEGENPSNIPYATGRITIEPKPFIPGFEENLIGLKVGETKTFQYTYPDNEEIDEKYRAKTYTFEIKVNAIYKTVLPELDDDFANEYDGSSSLTELKNKIKENLKSKYDSLLKKHTLKEAYQKIIQEGKYTIPKSLIQAEINHLFERILNLYRIKKISMEEFAKLYGKPKEELESSLEKEALYNIQLYITKSRLAEDEKIQLTEEEIQNEIKKIAETLGMQPESLEKNWKKEGSWENFRQNILFEKVDNFVYSTIDKKGPKTVKISEANHLLQGVEKAT